jgi:hypothetical protein
MTTNAASDQMDKNGILPPQKVKEEFPFSQEEIEEILPSKKRKEKRGDPDYYSVTPEKGQKHEQKSVLHNLKSKFEHQYERDIHVLEKRGHDFTMPKKLPLSHDQWQAKKQRKQLHNQQHHANMMKMEEQEYEQELRCRQQDQMYQLQMQQFEEFQQHRMLLPRKQFQPQPPQQPRKQSQRKFQPQPPQLQPQPPSGYKGKPENFNPDFRRQKKEPTKPQHQTEFAYVSTQTGKEKVAVHYVPKTNPRKKAESVRYGKDANGVIKYFLQTATYSDVELEVSSTGGFDLKGVQDALQLVWDARKSE